MSELMSANDYLPSVPHEIAAIREAVHRGIPVVDAIDGSGAYRRNMASPEQLEVLAMAERLYGCNLSIALTRWLAMERLEYFDFANRPEVVWSGAVPHVN